MERNPYTPPSTPVADIASAPVAVNREVLIACKIFWISFGLTLIGNTIDILSGSTMSRTSGGLTGALIGVVLGFASTWWINSKLKAGRNWMRLLVTASAVISYISIPIFWRFYDSTVFPLYAGNRIEATVGVLGTILGTWGIVLLNVPRSRAWFSATKRRELAIA
jgi:hypothetical protein